MFETGSNSFGFSDVYTVGIFLDKHPTYIFLFAQTMRKLCKLQLLSTSRRSPSSWRYSLRGGGSM